MNICPLFVLFLLSAVACLHTPYTQWTEAKNVLAFENDIHTSFDEEFRILCDNYFGDTERSHEMFREIIFRIDETGTQLPLIESDPFHTQSYQQVAFNFYIPAQGVAQYYSHALRKHGWTFLRGILLTEYTNSVGDWLEVYQKDNALVRIHILSYNSEQYHPDSLPQGWAICHPIYFSFINISPNTFFRQIGHP